MTTLNILLPDDLQTFINEQIAQGGYNSASEYIYHLILQDQKQTAQAKLEEMLLEGLDSGPSIEVTEQWWEQKRANLVKQHQKSE